MAVCNPSSGIGVSVRGHGQRMRVQRGGNGEGWDVGVAQDPIVAAKLSAWKRSLAPSGIFASEASEHPNGSRPPIGLG
jgi:hypothetical protein